MTSSEEMDTRSVFRALGIEDFDPNRSGYLKPKRIVVNKSKSGCIACKWKKVKCDEEKPICRRCRRNERDCVFEQDSHGIEKRPPVAPEKEIVRTSDAILIQHCEDFWDDIFNIPRGEEIMHLFRTDEAIFNTLLAISACHLRKLAPQQEHHIAESFYRFQSIKFYRNALDPLDCAADLDRAKKLFLVGLFLNMLTFILPAGTCFNDKGPSIQESCIYSEDENRFDWINIHFGFRRLLLSTASHQGEITAFLGSIILGTSDMSDALPQSVMANDAIPSHWRRVFNQFFEEQVTGCESDDTYLVPLTYIANLRMVEPTERNSFIFLSFLMKIDSNFRGLLLMRDKKAVWILGYWFGLMCRLPKIWWCEERAQRDYMGICTWFQQWLFEKTHSQDIEWQVMIDELMQVPYTHLNHSNDNRL